MKKYQVALSLIIFCATAFAQQDTTLVYSSPMYTKDPIRAKWRPVVKRNGALFQVSFYDKKDVIREIINFEDKNLEVRKGPYASYGLEKQKDTGTYDKGHKNGEWLYYNQRGEKTRLENFVYGKLDGKYVSYWASQKVQEEGRYNANKKLGTWLLFYEDGKTAGEEGYDNEGKKIAGKYYDRSGGSVNYEDLFASPTHKDGINGFYKYLANNIQFPPDAIKSGASGTVRLSFIVNKDGKVEDIIVVQTPDYDLEREAIRVLSKSKWIPGKRFGEIVSTRYQIPIKFSRPKQQ